MNAQPNTQPTDPTVNIQKWLSAEPDYIIEARELIAGLEDPAAARDVIEGYVWAVIWNGLDVELIRWALDRVNWPALVATVTGRAVVDTLKAE